MNIIKAREEMMRQMVNKLDSAVYAYVVEMIKVVEKAGGDPEKFEIVWETKQNGLTSSVQEIYIQQRTNGLDNK